MISPLVRTARFSSFIVSRKLGYASASCFKKTAPSYIITFVSTAAAAISALYLYSTLRPPLCAELKDNEPTEADLVAKLSMVLKADQIEEDINERKLRGKPWNSYHYSKFVPSCVVYPESTEDVSKVLKLCNTLKVPVVAFGGGTSIEGQTLFMNPGSNISVSLDFNRMTSVIDFNEDDLDITVQPGLGIE
jgi:D-lactate dehydrogenase (cytochrome)